MKTNHIKHILRNAVIATLPMALQVGCAAPVPPPDTGPVDPCRGPITRTPKHEVINAPVENVAVPSFDACVELCKQTVQRRVLSMSPPSIEGFKASECAVSVHKTGSGQINCTADYTEVYQSWTGAPGCPVPGRMPAGSHLQGHTANSALGHYFAQMSAMESAAVTAFRYLLRELEAYQAPEGLIRLARAAIGEEINHAKLAGLLAEAYDAPVPRVGVADFQLRTLFEIALENALEGCVNETFAAACGLWQQEQAEDETFRSVIAHVTEDECRHAALSWAIHDWVMPQLGTAEQAHIRQAQAEAVAQLADNGLQAVDPALRRAVGLPDTADAARLVAQLRVGLWHA